MLRILRRLRLAHLLAVLAIVLAAGLGQHAHASDAPVVGTFVDLADTGPGGEDGDGAIPSDHCTSCHVARGLAPGSASVREPALFVIAGLALPHVLGVPLAAPDEPVRPPRSPRPA